jgi:hypothetical protein
MGGYVFQDLTVQAVQNLTKRIVRVVEKKWLFKSLHPQRRNCYVWSVLKNRDLPH